MGKSFVCIGSNSTHPTAEGNYCTTAFFSSGFKTTVDLPPGRYVYVFREGNAADNFYILSEVRMYGMPNLLRSDAASVSTLTYNSIYDPLNQDALNLFKNLETRATVD
jgi:hypothetical protein